MYKTRLLVTDEQEPTIKIKSGMKFEVTSIPLIDASSGDPTKVAARLCGGTSYCIALTELDVPSIGVTPDKGAIQHSVAKDQNLVFSKSKL